MNLRTYRLTAIALLFSLGSLFAEKVDAQTLNEQLVQEDPAVLVRDAMERGDIVRGAILFHQGNINCAKCHRAADTRNPLGPDLSQLGPDATGPHIVESILLPSKKIREGYESIVALTEDGQIFNGIVVKETDDQISIRDGNQVDQLITLNKSDLEGIRPGTQSNMPADLANQLKNRQQFLDLLRYVLNLKEQGVNGVQASKPSAPIRHELSDSLEGVVAIHRMNCTACHAPGASLPMANLSAQAPRLNWSVRWLHPDYLEEFIANPHQVKPGTRMPDLMGNLNATERQANAKAIAQFLMSQVKNEFATQPVDRSAALEGHTSFQSVGCVACHAPRGADGKENNLPHSVPLGQLTGKYNIEGLTEFLKDPLAARPAGHMPSLQLSHREAVNIANFLLQSSEPIAKEVPPFVLEPEQVAQGKGLFEQFNCANCHTEITNQTPKQFAPALDQVGREAGCLADSPGDGVPHFSWTEKERSQIRMGLAGAVSDVSLSDRIDLSLRLFRCTNCHQRNDLGGVLPERTQYFETTNLNLGEQGKIPPYLSGVGAKLKPAWLRDVLINGKSIRPYMLTRMPQYGEQNIGHLVEMFDEADHLGTTTFGSFEDPKKVREEGTKLVGNQGFNCVACHTYRFQTSDTMPAVDLTEMADRLEKDWFYQYMLAPQEFSPNTVMPSFWPGGKAIRSDLAGTPEDQVEAIWQYLTDGRQARPPRGVVREPLEIVVTDQAQMLRRKYPGIGKRGIGVGYPGGVNIAFDAEQLRLGLLWTGKFADPGGVWRGQGSGNVRPMGRPIEFAKGPDIDLQDDVWEVDDGRPPHHRFLGYSLDSQQRPTFRYRVGDYEVEDFFREQVTDQEQVEMVRTVRIQPATSTTPLRWRLARSEQLELNDEQIYQVNGQLAIHLSPGTTAEIREIGNQKELVVALPLKPDAISEFQVTYRLKK